MKPEATRLLRFTDGAGERIEFELDDAPARLAIGRATDSNVRLAWDSEVSRLHAVIERIGNDWIVSDDGISRNGTFVNGERLTGRQRLFRGDKIRVGSTVIDYFEFDVDDVAETQNASMNVPSIGILPDTQRKVLIALCRPYKVGGAIAGPATNQQIADELYLSLDAVKSSLRTLCEKFGVADLPQNQKRLRLAALALHHGIVGQRDF